MKSPNNETAAEDGGSAPAKIYWIVVNLPWRDTNSAELHEVRRLSSEYANWFNAKVIELFGPIPDPKWDITRVHKVLEACPDLDTTDWSDVNAYNTFVATHLDADERVVAARRRYKALRDQFETNSIECQEWQRRIAAASEQASSRQFCDHALCRPGVALEIRSATGELRRVIIGDVDNGGHDLATPAIAGDDVIVRCADLRPLVEEMAAS